MRPFLLYIALLVAASTAAHGEIQVGESLEYLADTCPYIGVYTFDHMSPGSKDCLPVVASLTKTLRGQPPSLTTFTCPNPDSAWNQMRIKLHSGDHFLVFFRDAGTNDVRIEVVISLTEPIRGGELSAALEPDFSVVSNEVAIEKIVHDRIASKPVRPVRWRDYPDNRFRLEVPPGTPAYGALFGGSSCYLIVPDDLLAMSKAHLSK